MEAPSLEAWFEGYVDHTGWWDKLENGEDPDLPPWPDFRHRARND